MKKYLLFIAVALVAVINASAYDAEVDGIFYTLKSDITFEVCSGGPNSYTGEVDIPSEVVFDERSFPVTSIAEGAFRGCSGLSGVTIPGSVSVIGVDAFRDCTGLREAIIPYGVTTIGASAFYGCSSLESVIIPSSVVAIGYQAFFNCLIRHLSIDNEKFLSKSFFGTSIESLVIGSNVTTIGSEAFWRCSSLASVEIGGNVNSIGDYAFKGCSSLTSIEIPNSVTSIGNWAFEDCSTLAFLVVGSNVTSIGECAFRNCTSLSSVDVPNSVSAIGDYAFSVCPIKQLNIDNERFLSQDVFGTEIETLVLGTHVATINGNTLNDCSIKRVYLRSNTPPALAVATDLGPKTLLFGTLYVSENESAYRNHAVWGRFHYGKNNK